MNGHPPGEKNVMHAEVLLRGGTLWEATAGSGHRLTVDGPPEAGGNNAGFRPMELMLLGLGCCMGYDMVMILRRMRQEVTGYRIRLTGQRAEEPPRVYTEVILEHRIIGKGVRPEAVKRAMELAEGKYCSASAMFSKTATLIQKFQIDEDAG
jgi:putative redox protein